MSNISQLDRVKIQARTLIPIIKAFEAELGKENTHQKVGETIAASLADLLFKLFQRRDMHPSEVDFGDTPTVSDILENTDNSFAYNVTKCGFAEYFRNKGEQEIGYLMTCGTDFAVADALCQNWDFSRTQTIMEGASHCDFRYKMKKQ